MIERIDEVTDLGLFTDYRHGADCDFKDITLVFGENGVGKTTIAALLDSVRSGNAESMLRRARLGAAQSPTAQIEVAGFGWTAERGHLSVPGDDPDQQGQPRRHDWEDQERVKRLASQRA